MLSNLPALFGFKTLSLESLDCIPVPGGGNLSGAYAEANYDLRPFARGHLAVGRG